MRFENKILLVLLLGFVSCIKFDLHQTSHPDMGEVLLTCNWANRSESIDIPAQYTVRINEQSVSLPSAINPQPLPLMPAGKYQLLVYNIPNKMSVTGTIASVDTLDGYVDIAPDCLFSHAQTLRINADSRQLITANMVQQVRQLQLVVSVTKGNIDLISSIAIELDGVASQIDIDKNEVVGQATKARCELVRTDQKLTANVRLLGVIPTASQNLTLHVEFTNGTSRQFTQNVNSKLLQFNIEKHRPMSLSSDMELGGEVAAGADFTADISDWQADIENVIAD